MSMNILNKRMAKVADQIPTLVNIMSENDAAYNQLIQALQKVNVKREAKGKYIIDFIGVPKEDKPSVNP